MSLLGKIFVVINVILALVFLGVTSALHYSSQDWRLAAERLHVRYQEVVKAKNVEIDALKGSVTQLEQTRERIEAELVSAKDIIKAEGDKFTAKNEEFLKARKDLDELMAAHKVISGSLDGMNRSLDESRTRIEQLTAERNEASSNKETAEAQVARLIGQKAALEKDLGEVRKEFADTRQSLLDLRLVMDELQRIGVPVDTLVVNHRPVPPINGKVAGIDTSVSPGIVLITVGKDDKVQKGYPFTVYRGSTFVGKVVVEKVNADSAGCRVLFTAPGKTIQKGDDAATRLD